MLITKQLNPNIYSTMANNNNKDYQSKTQEHDQLQIPNDQVSVNQDHEQSHELLGDNGKSSINSGLEPLSRAVANETTTREGITGADLGYGTNETNSSSTTTNSNVSADNQVNSQGVNATGGGVGSQSSNVSTDPILSGGQGDNAQDITREQGGGQGGNNTGTTDQGQGGDNTMSSQGGQGGDVNPQAVDKELGQIDQTVATNQNVQSEDDSTTNDQDNTTTTDNNQSQNGEPIPPTTDPQVQQVVDQQDPQSQANGQGNQPALGPAQEAAAGLKNLLDLKDDEDTVETNNSGQGQGGQGGDTANSGQGQGQGGQGGDNTSTTDQGQGGQGGDTTTTDQIQGGEGGDNTTTTTTASGETPPTSFVDRESAELLADITPTTETQETITNQEADANAQAPVPNAPVSDGGASLGKEHGFMVGVSVGFEKKLKLKQSTGDAVATTGLEFAPPEEFIVVDTTADKTAATIAAERSTAISNYRDANKALADKIAAIGTGQIGETEATILKDYIRALPTGTAQSFESYVSGYLQGFNEGYPVGRRKLAERLKEAENNRKTTPDYEAGQEIGAEHGTKAAKGEEVSEVEKTNAKAGLDANGAKIKNKEGNDVSVAEGNTYIQGYYQAFNEYYMKGRQQIANERKAAEEALLQDPDFRAGYDVGFASGFWTGKPTQAKFQEVADQAEKNLTDLGLTPDSLEQRAAQFKALNPETSEQDKKKKTGFYVGFNKGYIQARVAINKVYQDELKAKMEDPAYMAGKQAGDLGGMFAALSGSKAAALELATDPSKWTAFRNKNKIAITLTDEVMNVVKAGLNGQPESLAIISGAAGEDQAKKIAYFKEAFAVNFNQGWAKGRNKQVQNAQTERAAKLHNNTNYTDGEQVGKVAAQAVMLRTELVQQTKEDGTNPKLEQLDKHLKTIRDTLTEKGNSEDDKAFKVGYYTAYNAKVREHIIANIDADNKKKREEVQNMQNSESYKIGEKVGAEVAKQKVALNQKIAATTNLEKKREAQKQLSDLMAKVQMRSAAAQEEDPEPKTIFEKVKKKGEENNDPTYFINFKQGYNAGYYRAGAVAAGIGGTVDYGQGNEDLAKKVEDVATSHSKDNSIDSLIKKAEEEGKPRAFIDNLKELKEIPQKDREETFKEGANYGYTIWFENQKKSTEEGANPKQEDASEIEKKVTSQLTKIEEKYKKLKKVEDGKETNSSKYTVKQQEALVGHYKRGHDVYGKPKGVIDGDSYRVGFEFGKKLGAGLAKEKAGDKFYDDFNKAKNGKIAGEAKVLGLREARYNTVSNAIDASEGRKIEVRETLIGHARKGYDLAIKPWKKIYALSKDWPIGDELKEVSIDLPEVITDPEDSIDLPISTDDSELKQQALDKISQKEKLVEVQVELYKKKRHQNVQAKELDKIIHNAHEKAEFNDFIVINGALEGAAASKLSTYVKELIAPDLVQFKSGYEKAIEAAATGSGGDEVKTIFKAQGFRDGLIVGSEKTKETIEQELGFTLPVDTIEPNKEHEEYKKGYQEGLKAGLDAKLGIRKLSDFSVGLRGNKYQEGHKAGKTKAEDDAKNHGSSAESSVPNLESSNPNPEYKEGYETAYAETYWPLRAANYGYYKGVETVKNGGNAFQVPNPIPTAPVEMNDHYAKFERGFINGREAAMGGNVSDEDFKKMQDKEAFAAQFLNKSKNYRVGFDWGYKRIKDQIDKVKKSMAGENKPENIDTSSQADPPPPPKEETSEELYIEQIKTFLSGEQVLGILEDEWQYNVAEQTSKENNPKEEDKSTTLKQMEYTLAVYSGIKSGVSGLKVDAKSTDVSKIGYDNIKSQFESALAALATKISTEKKKEDAFKDLNITEDFASKSSEWIAAVGEFGGGYQKGLEEANPEEIYRFAEELARIYAQMNAQYQAGDDLGVIEHIKKEQTKARETEAAKNTGNSQGGEEPIVYKEMLSFDKDKKRDPILDFPRSLKVEPDDGKVAIGTHFRRLLQALATWNPNVMFARFSTAYKANYTKPYYDYHSHYSARFLYGGPKEIAGADGAATASSGNSVELQQALDALKDLIDTESSLVDFKFKDLPILPMFLEQRYFMEQRHRDISSKQDEIYFEQEEQFVLEELIRDSNAELARIQKIIDDEKEKPVPERDPDVLKDARLEKKEYEKYIKEDQAELKKVIIEVEKYRKGLDEELGTAKGFFRDKAKFKMDAAEDKELFSYLDLLKSNAELSGEFNYKDSKMEVKGRGTYILDKKIQNIKMEAPTTMTVGGIDMTGQGFTRDKDNDFVSLFRGTVVVPRVEGDFNEKVIKDGSYNFNQDLVFTTSTGVHSQLKYHKESGKLQGGN